MPWYDASFGSAQTGLVTVGYRQVDNAGATVVARTTVGVVEIGGGGYGVDVVLNANTVTLEWDTGGGSPIFAHEDLEIRHDDTLAAIAALNDVSIADIQTALTNQGYTVGRAPNLDNLDVAVSTRNSVVPMTAATSQTEHDATQAAIAALNDLDITDVQTALTNQGYTPARAILLDNLDVAVSTRNAVTPMTAATSQAEHDATQAAIALIPTVAAPTALENADALLDRDLSAVTVSNTRSPINALRFLRNRWEAVGLALTVYEEDDATPAWTSTLTADPLADPVVQSDPA